MLCIIEEADDDVNGNAESGPQGVADEEMPSNKRKRQTICGLR